MSVPYSQKEYRQFKQLFHGLKVSQFFDLYSFDIFKFEDALVDDHGLVIGENESLADAIARVYGQEAMELIQKLLTYEVKVIDFLETRTTRVKS